MLYHFATWFHSSPTLTLCPPEPPGPPSFRPYTASGVGPFVTSLAASTGDQHRIYQIVEPCCLCPPSPGFNFWHQHTSFLQRMKVRGNQMVGAGQASESALAPRPLLVLASHQECWTRPGRLTDLRLQRESHTSAQLPGAALTFQEGRGKGQAFLLLN